MRSNRWAPVAISSALKENKSLLFSQRLKFSGDTKSAGFPPVLTFDSISLPDSFYFPLKISPFGICAILKLLEKYCPCTSLKLELLTFFFFLFNRLSTAAI